MLFRSYGRRSSSGPTLGWCCSVATASSTPAITLTTSVNGMVKGNGTGFSAATSGTDYSAGTSALATGLLKSTTATGALSIAGSADITSALGYTPVNKAGDSMSANATFGLGQFASDPSTAGWTATQKGYSWFNTTSNQIKYWDGSAVQVLGTAGSGLTSLNGQIGSTQTFANGTTGTAPTFSSATNTHTLNIPMASSAGVTRERKSHGRRERPAAQGWGTGRR